MLIMGQGQVDDVREMRTEYLRSVWFKTFSIFKSDFWIKPRFKYSNAMIISIIININFHNTNHYTQLFIQSNHFPPLKNIFFQSQKFNTNHYTQLFIQFNHFQSLPTIEKHFFQYQKFNTQIQIQKEFEFYSTSKHIFIASKSANRFRILFLLKKFNTQTDH
jgi:hypothetical protein